MTKNTAILPNLSYVPKQADHDELASAKLWAVYISEAEKYDKALVESWKSDMDGLLIFAGLFSASLTAFLVESYKTLSPDQGAMTIALLAQISRQLAASPSTTSMATIDPSFTTPSAATLACNILWFLSLGLSLSCALFATLVQQWARDFIQRTEMRPSPAIRARIFSYLYFGMQRFGMHTIVGFIPLLLHLSLLLFFTGLVAFLKPINQVMVIVAALMLGSISAIYICITILPIISSDVPYRTPLSNVVWQVYQHLSVLLYWSRKFLWDEEKGQKDDKSPYSDNQRPKRDEECGNADREPHHDIRSICTLVAMMNQHATERSPQRDDRDGRAIVWTLKSLTDNDELQPFVEALPDLIWGPNGRRHMYDAMINMLLADRNIRLVQRIEGLLQSCDYGLLRPEHEMLRRIACIKALWAIAYFLASDPSTRETFPNFEYDCSIIPAPSSQPEGLPLFVICICAGPMDRVLCSFSTRSEFIVHVDNLLQLSKILGLSSPHCTQLNVKRMHEDMLNSVLPSLTSPVVRCRPGRNFAIPWVLLKTRHMTASWDTHNSLQRSMKCPLNFRLPAR
ncbi:hypothetical protein C8J57DRAFT_693369 [Mycena rebaudengoi]|nr:hypothetical protein C8J57DRAFT_693369 [Mycena rebaudengoi]